MPGRRLQESAGQNDVMTDLANQLLRGRGRNTGNTNWNTGNGSHGDIDAAREARTDGEKRQSSSTRMRDKEIEGDGRWPVTSGKRRSR